MNQKYDTVKYVLQILRQGNLKEVLEYGPILNGIINEIMSMEECDTDTVECMDNILRICNILYNMTDIQVLPVEDGIYDILLEKYKQYNPTGFQVGSEIINFAPVDGTTLSSTESTPALKFYTDEDIEHLQNGFFSSNLYIEPSLTPRDCSYNPIYFTNTITKRTHDTEHEHPELVGTLDKAKFVLCEDAITKGVYDDNNVKILERDFFAEHIKSGVLDPNRRIKMVLELKYDGVSVEGDCGIVLESARSRGDTGIGKASDITPILEGYGFPHSSELIKTLGHTVGVKFEAIMTHGSLYKFNITKNYTYKNCRTAIVGLFGSGDAPLYRDYITLVPLAIDRSEVPGVEWDRVLEIEFMNKYFRSKGQPLRYAVVEGTYRECLFYIKKFVEEAEAARAYLDFMYDGIVVSYLDEDIRQALGRVNFVNKYSMAVKFNPLRKQTYFRGYTYTIGQDGSITPMIHYDAVEFFGTIHTKSTGSSYARFMDLGLRYGDILNVEYTNDVMPYVTKPECEYNSNNTNPVIEFITTCPDCGTPLEVSASGKTMVCNNIECNSRVIARMANMLDKLNLKDFGEERIRALAKAHLSDIVEISLEDAINIFGDGMGQKFIEIMSLLKTEPIFDFTIVGALGFTSIASKKWRLIFSVYTLEELYILYKQNQLSLLSTIKGIGPALVETIEREFPYFEKDIQYILSMSNLKNSKGVSFGKTIRCSGFRNPELMEELRRRGYDADDNASVTKGTDILLIPMADYSSSKTKKAGPNTQIIVVSEFIDNMNKYLN